LAGVDLHVGPDQINIALIAGRTPDGGLHLQAYPVLVGSNGADRTPDGIHALAPGEAGDLPAAGYYWDADSESELSE